MDLGFYCSVTVATDSQSVIGHSWRRVASKRVDLRGLWLQEALLDGTLELEKETTCVLGLEPMCVCAPLGVRVLSTLFVCGAL